MFPLLPDEPLGQLSIDEALVEVDGPRLFTCSNRTGQRFVGLFVDENDEGETYLLAAVSPDRHGAFRSGLVDARTVLLEQEEGHVYEVQRAHASGGTTVRRIAVGNIPEQWLPPASLRIALPTETRDHFSLAALQQRSLAERRTLASIELDGSGLRTEYPLRTLGTVLQLVQDNIYSIAQEIREVATFAGPIQQGILDEAELTFVETMAASFVVVVTPRVDNQLVEMPLARQSIQRFLDLLRSATDAAALGREIARLHTRSRSRLRELLEELDEVGSGVRLDLVTPSLPSQSARVTRTQVRSTLRAIRELGSDQTERMSITGLLVGANARTHVFELQDDSGSKFSGRAIGTAAAALQGLRIGDRYTGVLLREILVEALTGEVRHKYQLIEIDPA